MLQAELSTWVESGEYGADTVEGAQQKAFDIGDGDMHSRQVSGG